MNYTKLWRSIADNWINGNRADARKLISRRSVKTIMALVDTAYALDQKYIVDEIKASNKKQRELGLERSASK